MSRFPAELTITLHDGREITECFNQAEMAHVRHGELLDRLRAGESLVVYDGEEYVVEAGHVASIVVQERVLAAVR
jgi:hypothetical protein